MRIATLIIVSGALMAGAAQAGPVAPTGQKVLVSATTPAKTLIVCNEDEDARLVARDVDYGFVTAKQVMAGANWTGAKCITPAEARRLSNMKLSASK